MEKENIKEDKESNSLIGTCFLGWAGSGKTYMGSRLADYLGVDFIGESTVDSVFHKNITDPVTKYVMLKSKESYEIARLEGHIALKESFVSDMHMAGIYSTFTELLEDRKNVYDGIYRRFDESNQDGLVHTIGLDISEQQLVKNLQKRGDYDILKKFLPTMYLQMQGLMNYLTQHNLVNFNVVSADDFYPFDVNDFVEKSGLCLS